MSSSPSSVSGAAPTVFDAHGRETWASWTLDQRLAHIATDLSGIGMRVYRDAIDDARRLLSAPAASREEPSDVPNEQALAFFDKLASESWLIASAWRVVRDALAASSSPSAAKEPLKSACTCLPETHEAIGVSCNAHSGWCDMYQPCSLAVALADRELSAAGPEPDDAFDFLKSDNGFPRRSRQDLWTKAEHAICEAVTVCETTLPADTLETDAIILLGKARDKVGQLVDREIRAGRMEMPKQSPPIPSREDARDAARWRFVKPHLGLRREHIGPDVWAHWLALEGESARSGLVDLYHGAMDVGGVDGAVDCAIQSRIPSAVSHPEAQTNGN